MKVIEVGGGPLIPVDSWLPTGRFDDQTFNLDPYYGSGAWRIHAGRDLWPAFDMSIHRVRAIHSLEHMPAGPPRIHVFNEAHRVLMPGGIFEIEVPRFPHDAAVSDPTHVSFFVPDSFVYFTNPSVSGPEWKVWEMLDLKLTDATIYAEMRKP